ncbi:MAG: murein endopeptidase, partial [Deltaproteobacteria bacterium]
YAESIGEDSGWLDQLFGGPTTTLRPLIRHAKGHKTHIHVRFYNPVAQELGRRAYPILVAQDRIKPHTYFTRYRARKGDMLGRLANRFGCTVKAIQRANRLRSTRIRAGRTYLIPRKGKVAAPPKVIIPQRRLPPPAAGTRRHSVAAPDTGGSH